MVASTQAYVNYYLRKQRGGSLRDIGDVYRYTGIGHQRGYGFGSTLKKLYARFFPYIKSGFKALGKQGLDSGVNMLYESMGTNKPFKEILKNESSNAIKALSDKAIKKINEPSLKKSTSALSTENTVSKMTGAGLPYLPGIGFQRRHIRTSKFGKRRKRKGGKTSIKRRVSKRRRTSRPRRIKRLGGIGPKRRKFKQLGAGRRRRRRSKSSRRQKKARDLDIFN